MKSFFRSSHCRTRKHCRVCRYGEQFRRDIKRRYDDVESVNFDCPFGVTQESLKDELPPSGEPCCRKGNKGIKNKMVSGFEGNGAPMVFEVSQEEQVRRLDICGGCDEFTGDGCALCDCKGKWKTALSNDFCGLKKW